MEQHNLLSQGLKKRRQLLLVLPLLILPFMTLAFWALGGGQRQSEDGRGGKAAVTATGINPDIPRAKSAVGAQDKMTLYGEADRKAAAAKQNKIEDWGRYRYPASMDIDSTYESGRLSVSTEVNKYGINGGLNDADPNSLKIRQKLADLQAVLERAKTVHHSALALPMAERTAKRNGGQIGMQSGSGNEGRLSELDHLKDLITQSTDVNSSEDTHEINTMLDKILAIQRPAEMAETLKASSVARKASSSIYPISEVKATVKDDVQVPVLLPDMRVGKIEAAKNRTPAGKTAYDQRGNTPVVVETDSSGLAGVVRGENHDNADVANNSEVDLEANQDADGHGYMGDYPPSHSKGLVSAFYDIDAKDKKTGNDKEVYGNTTMAAVIAETQTLVSGGTVKMRLKTDVIIHGRLVPKGSFVYGTCRVNGERLKIEVRHIRLGDQLFSVKLRVFDLDGMEGIHIPGSISRDAVKQGAGRGLGSVRMMSLDPSVAAQAATAGMEAAKGLLSKKAKLVRVTVKAGYPIMLLDGKGLQ